METTLWQGWLPHFVELNILGVLAGTVIGLSFSWFWRERGIVPLPVILATDRLLFWWGSPAA